jgi:SAM-dependent methyltransferase
MRAEDFELLYRLEEKYWWFVAMRQITDTIAARELAKSNLKILDAGCGTGFNLGYYAASNSNDVYGLDIASAALDHVRARGFRKVAQASITDIPFRAEAFDLVFSFEVVTQTPYAAHDTALREMNRVLKPGGWLFIRVPAFMWLW